jgi:hypothetical protein
LDLENPEIPELEKKKLIDDTRALRKQIEDIEAEIDKIVNEIETTAGRVDGRMDVDSDNENQGQVVVDKSRASEEVDKGSNVPFSPQTKPIFDGESPSSYSTAEEEPSHYADFPDLTDDEDGPDGILDDGVRLVEANRQNGKLYLTSYGPKNSALITWTSVFATKHIHNVTNFHLHHQKVAMDRDKDGSLTYKGRIASIKQIAWQPRGDIRCIEDLLESVEELNPQNKKHDPKYRFPFSTALVDWTTGPSLSEPPKQIWIGRSDYKRLTTGKNANERANYKFYTKACLQVKRFKQWIGNERQGRDDISPTPLRETPFPETSSRNWNGQTPEGRNTGGAGPETQSEQNNMSGLPAPKIILENAESPAGSSNGRNEYASGTRSPQNVLNDDSGLFVSQQPDGPSGRKSITPETQDIDKVESKPFTFSKEKYLNDLRKNWRKLGLSEEEQMRKEALALAEYHTYKQEMLERGAIEEKD